ARPVLVRSLVPAVEGAGHLPAVAELAGGGVEHHRHLHPPHRHRRGSRSELAGARARSRPVRSPLIAVPNAETSGWIPARRRVARRGFSARDGPAPGGRSRSKRRRKAGRPAPREAPSAALRRLFELDRPTPLGRATPSRAAAGS